MKQLVELLEEGGQAYDWKTDIWTSKQVATLMAWEFDIDYTPHHCSRRICDLGYRPVKSKPRVAVSDPDEKRRWLNKEAEELKKAEQRRKNPVH